MTSQLGESISISLSEEEMKEFTQNKNERNILRNFREQKSNLKCLIIRRLKNEPPSLICSIEYSDIEESC